MLKRKMSLSELAEFHQLVRTKKNTFRIEGEVEVVVKNEDGSIDQVIKKKNAQTGLLQMYLVNPDISDLAWYVFIAPDDGWPMHPFKSYFNTLYQAVPTSNVQANITRSLDSTNLIWTFSHVFAAPPTNITFRYVGLSLSGGSSDLNNIWIAGVVAATRLTQELVQSTTQTLEVTYRVAFQRV